MGEASAIEDPLHSEAHVSRGSEMLTGDTRAVPTPMRNLPDTAPATKEASTCTRDAPWHHIFMAWLRDMKQKKELRKQQVHQSQYGGLPALDPVVAPVVAPDVASSASVQSQGAPTTKSAMPTTSKARSSAPRTPPEGPSGSRAASPCARTTVTSIPPPPPPTPPTSRHYFQQGQPMVGVGAVPMVPPVRPSRRRVQVMGTDAELAAAAPRSAAIGARVDRDRRDHSGDKGGKSGKGSQGSRGLHGRD